VARDGIVKSDARTLSSSTPWATVLAIAAAIACFYWFAASRSTLWDRDEPRFARATVEMIESGNYLYPTFNGQLRPDKPILVYWLMSVPIRLLGPTALACRFFSALGVAVACVLTFLIGRRLFTLEAGLWSEAILGSSTLVFIEGTLATADGILLPAQVAVLFLFVRALERPLRRHEVALMGLAFGWGLLAKGPVALLPIAVVLVTLWLTRKTDVRAGLCLVHCGIAVLLGSLVFLAWALPANQATEGEFLRLGLGHHVLARASKPFEGHGDHFLLHLPYYLPMIIAGFFPWSLHLPGSIAAVLGRRVGGIRFRRLFLAWAGTVLVIMTLVVTKLPHYILLMWPMLALAVAGTLTAPVASLTERDKDWLRGGIYFFGPVAILMVLSLLAAPFLLPLEGAVFPCWATAALLVFVSLLAMKRQLQNRFRASAVVLLVGIPAVVFVLMVTVMPVVERIKISPELGEAVNRATDDTVPVVRYGYNEASLIFYVGRPIEALANQEAVVAWAKESGRAVLILSEAALVEIEADAGPLGLETLTSETGLNPANGRPLSVLAMLRGAEASPPEDEDRADLPRGARNLAAGVTPR
jgi:4-amino-4-deoxy-L-arabinose transferase-like glycosyltransferase